MNITITNKCIKTLLFMSNLIQRIVYRCREIRQENVMNKSGFVICLRNIHLRQRSALSVLNATVCVCRENVKYDIDKIPLKYFPKGDCVWLDLTEREKELTEGEWVVKEMKVSEGEKVICCYEVCRPIMVAWGINNWYDWVVDDDWGGIGNGSKKQPYEVCSPRMLDRVRNYADKGNVCFRQMCDIQFAGALKIRYNKAERVFVAEPEGYLGDEKGWIPIGLYTGVKEETPFQGGYDGGGFYIHGLFINRPNCDVQGLFGIVEGVSKRVPACLLDIHMGNTCVIIGQAYLGSIVGNAGYAVIQNCTNDGQINGTKNVGGIAGATIHTEVTGCYNSGYIIGIRDWNDLIGRDAGSDKGK